MIKSVVVTEKASQVAEKNCYVFLVENFCNKVELKRFVQNRYGVQVHRVNILNTPQKKVRRGRVFGYKRSKKKAYIYTDQKIEILEGNS